MECKFYQRVKELRTMCNMSQSDLAKICGVKNVDVSRWEANQHIPTLSNILAIAKYFAIDIDYLVGRRD